MPKKILVVEDNRMMLNFLTKTLEQEKHQVVSAEDGLSALDILTSFTPDIIFLDLILPKIGGEKLCQIVRKMQHLADCYLVVLSAAVAEMEYDYKKIGADTCIAKGPFGSMAKHVLAAIKESDASREERPDQIVGLDEIHARQMTKELLSQNRHLEAILESISEGILEVYSGRVVYANSAVVFLLGIPEEKLLGSYFIDLFGDDLRPLVESLLDSKTGAPSDMGLNSPLEINDRLIIITNLPVKSDPSTTIILMTDVTKRKRLEIQLQHAQRMEAIGTIASGVAHNFRNTLAGILANTQVIQMNLADDSELHANAKRIDSSVKKGVQLVDGLMQFSRKQVKNEFKRLNLSTVIQETYELVKESFNKNIDIQVDIPQTLPIVGDSLGLSQAMMNLYTNARDSMPDGGELRIEAMQIAARAVVIVSDTGQGMDMDTAARCFDPFFTTKDVGKGTGLGLSTTYSIIKNHEGEISVTSKLNRGSAFKIRLPLAAAGKLARQEYPAEVVHGNGEKILVVDDETEILQAMPDLLKSLGYQAEIAGNGKDAIDIYKVWQPDVILMDIAMPEMDGMTCIEKIMEFDPHAKAIIISGYEESATVGLDESKMKLIKGFLTKPIKIYELSDSIARCLH